MFVSQSAVFRAINSALLRKWYCLYIANDGRLFGVRELFVKQDFAFLRTDLTAKQRGASLIGNSFGKSCAVGCVFVEFINYTLPIIISYSSLPV